MKKEYIKEIYPYLDIEYNGIDTVEDIASERDKIYSRDLNFLKSNPEEYEFDSWSELTNGRFDVHYGEYNFSCLFNRKDGPLYVILNAALLGERPEFKRWTYYSFLNGSMLNIADPMYYIYDELKLGWFYGDRDNNLRQYTANIIEKAANILGVSNDNIIIIGSSGGGAAAIQVGHMLDGSTSISINAQIKLSLYYYHEIFRSITGIDVTGYDPMGRNDTSEILLDNKSNSRHILIENILSRVDCDQLDYIIPIIKKKPRYGLTQYGDNLLIWMYDAIHRGKSGAHGAQEFHGMLYYILLLVELFKSGQVNEFQSIYRLMNEFWRDNFKLNDEIKKYKEIVLRAPQKFIFIDDISYYSEKLIVYEENNFVLKASASEKYKSLTIEEKLRPNSSYVVLMKNIKFNNKTNGKFTILLKDNKNQEIYCREDCSVSEVVKYGFQTNGQTDSIVVKIYAGLAGHTDNCEMIIGNIQLIQCSNNELTESQEKEREINALNLPAELIDLKTLEPVYREEFIREKAKDNEKYKMFEVKQQLKNNKIYCLQLTGIKLINGNSFSILFRDMKKNEIYCRRDFEVTDVIKYLFITNSDTTDISFRIYVGNPARTQNRSIMIDKLELYELNNI